MLKTACEYMESFRKLKLNLYLLGERVDNWVEHPIIRPAINAIAMTYKLAHEPSQDAIICPVGACLPDPNHKEGHEQLLEKWRELHPRETPVYI